MASGFQGGGDIFGMAGGSAVGSFPIQVPYHQRRLDIGVPAGGLGGGEDSAKRPLAELQSQQLQPPAFVRSVRQKTLLQQSTTSSPVDLAASASSSATSFSSTSFSSACFHRPGEAPASVSTARCSAPPRNLSYLFLQQQLLLQQQRQRQQGHNHPNLAANLSFPPPLPTVAELPLSERKPKNETVAMKNRLQELEKQLLDDDTNEEEEASISGFLVTASAWSETMQNLISPSSCSASSPKSTLSPPSSSTTTTTSSSSSSSSSSSCCPPSRQLLLDAASAIADGNTDAATATLDRLQKASAANPHGDPDQRLTAYMVAALQARISSLSSPPEAPRSFPTAELCGVEHLRATRMLYESSPCFYLGFVAANLAILDATRGHSKIHILDLDVGQGVQYAALVNALAERQGSSGLPAVRITAVVDPTLPCHSQNNSSSGFLKMVAERIEKQAEHRGVALRFNVLYRRASDLDAAALCCEPEEALAVNLAFLLYHIPDESVTPDNPRDQLLRRVRALAPRVVTLVEQEMSCNTAPFAARFAEASAYCRALFESLEATAPRDSAGRLQIEECLGRKVANAVSREGPERLERCEVFGKWRARMAMAGYRPTPLGPAVVEPVRARLGGKNPGFTLREEAGAVCLGWADRVLTVTSAWR